MEDFSLNDVLPADFEARARDEAARGNVPFVILRPDKGAASRPEPIGIVFGPTVPRVGEVLLWENGETYAIVGVTHRLTTDVDAPPYQYALPMLATRPMVEGKLVLPEDDAT